LFASRKTANERHSLTAREKFEEKMPSLRVGLLDCKIAIGVNRRWSITTIHTDDDAINAALLIGKIQVLETYLLNE